MATSFNIKPFAKYGLTDGNGRVIVPPTFDSIIANEFFILVEKDKRWGILKEFKRIEEIEYKFDEVKVFDRVLWFKVNGRWGAINQLGVTLVEPRYMHFNLMKGADIIECWNKSRYEYFTFFGEKLANDVDIIKIFDFNMGYAFAVGYEEGYKHERYFIVESRQKKVLTRSFDNPNECLMLLEELRSDYIWSMPRK